MSQLPNFAFIVIEDLVFSVVLLHVRSNHVVVDDSRADCLLVLLDLLLRLEGRLDLSLHG